jgi:non-homologous end joining protein Ku
VLRPAQGVLALHTLFAAAEVLSPEHLALPHRPPHPLETKAAQEWITRLSRPYVPEQWEDRFQVALSALLARKAKASVNRVPTPPARNRRKVQRPASKAAA